MNNLKKMIFSFSLVLFLATLIDCQEYKSVIVPSDRSNNPIDVNFYNDAFIVKSLNFFTDGGRGSILYRVDQDLNLVSQHDIEGISLTRKSPISIGNRLFGFGTNRLLPGKYSLLEFNEELEEISRYDYISRYIDGGAVSTARYENKILGLVWDKEGCIGCIEKVRVSLLSQDGEEKVLGDYHEDLKRSFAKSIVTTEDGNMVFFGNQEYEGFIGSTAVVTKINDEGDIIWKYIGTDIQTAPDAGVFGAELSNGNIVFTDEVSRIDHPDFPVGINWRPWKLQWLSPTGDSIGEYVHKTISKVDSEITGIATGKNGDYFFIHGRYNKVNDSIPPQGYYGFIWKISNDGEVIWDRKYHHTGMDLEAYHSIANLIELDNGDLVTIGIVSGLEKLEMWMMRLNSEGCFGEPECGEENIYTNTEDILSFDQSLNIFPNPSSGQINLAGIEESVIKVEVMSLHGRSMLVSEGFNIITVNTNDLPEGMYIIRTTTSESKIYTAKVLVD